MAIPEIKNALQFVQVFGILKNLSLDNARNILNPSNIASISFFLLFGPGVSFLPSPLFEVQPNDRLTKKTTEKLWPQFLGPISISGPSIYVDACERSSRLMR